MLSLLTLRTARAIARVMATEAPPPRTLAERLAVQRRITRACATTLAVAEAELPTLVAEAVSPAFREVRP